MREITVVLVILLLSYFVSCGESDKEQPGKAIRNRGEGSSSRGSFDSADAQKAFARLTAALDAAGVAASGKEPAEILEELLALEENNQQRHIAIAEFFVFFSKEDPELASSLLPDDLSDREQLHWASPVLEQLMIQGTIEAAVEFLKSKFTGTGTKQMAIGTGTRTLREDQFSYEDVMKFWEGVGDAEYRDNAALNFGSLLAKKAPEKAVEWFEQLPRDVRENAISSGLAGSTNEAVLLQLDVAKDPDVRKMLARVFGERLRSEADGSVESAMAKLSQLPAELVSDVEVGYVRTFGPGPAGAPPDLKAAKEFVSLARTQEGKDAAYQVIAGQELAGAPETTLNMLMETGFSERNPDTWGRYITGWLRKDGMSASRYVEQLPEGPSRRVAIEATVSYLQSIGDSTSAARWNNNN